MLNTCPGDSPAIEGGGAGGGAERLGAGPVLEVDPPLHELERVDDQPGNPGGGAGFLRIVYLAPLDALAAIYDDIAEFTHTFLRSGRAAAR